MPEDITKHVITENGFHSDGPTHTSPSDDWHNLTSIMLIQRQRVVA